MGPPGMDLSFREIATTTAPPWLSIPTCPFAVLFLILISLLTITPITLLIIATLFPPKQLALAETAAESQIHNHECNAKEGATET
jgi:hypothetical protein